MAMRPRIRGMVLCLKSCPGRELKPCLAEGVPRLHPHLAQRLEPSSGGVVQPARRGQRSDRQGCVPSISPCLQLADLCRPGVTALQATAAQSWQHPEPFPSSQSVRPPVSKEDDTRQAGWWVPALGPPLAGVPCFHGIWW